MKKATFLVFAVGMLINVTTVKAEGFFSSCPTAADLDQGIIFTTPARVGVLYKRYRRLSGPLIGNNYINGIFPDRTSVTYAGLFTHKHWRDGNVIQYEEPLTDMSELLQFKVGTEHIFESVRYNPATPSRKVKTTATYFIEKADEVDLGGCIYSAVHIRKEGSMEMADGKVVSDNQSFRFIPKLYLKVSGNYGDIEGVRNRRFWDNDNWPFSEKAVEVLSD
ncbi:hypothetical protein [Kiloniella sp.]|uniref:hypothetical protein n=1 Tax=Kiloniella sp. TaxID=1938587 RepID=UPI003B01106E